MTADFAPRVQRSFSRSFDSYHAAAGQQARIAHQLVELLRTHGAPEQFASALEFGCGTGHLTQRLRRTFDLGELTVNDLSPEAHETAQRFNANFAHGDARRIAWPEQADLIVSASMVQWLDDPAAFLRRAAQALAPGGWLAISGFGPEQYRELVGLGTAAKAPGLCSSDRLRQSVQSDLDVVAAKEEIRQMGFGSPRMVLEHLRKTGVNGRANKTWTKSTLARFMTEYSQRFATAEGVSLTYHPVWLIARKPDRA